MLVFRFSGTGVCLIHKVAPRLGFFTAGILVESVGARPQDLRHGFVSDGELAVRKNYGTAFLEGGVLGAETLNLRFQCCYAQPAFNYVQQEHASPVLTSVMARWASTTLDSVDSTESSKAISSGGMETGMPST